MHARYRGVLRLLTCTVLSFAELSCMGIGLVLRPPLGWPLWLLWRPHMSVSTRWGCNSWAVPVYINGVVPTFIFVTWARVVSALPLHNVAGIWLIVMRPLPWQTVALAHRRGVPELSAPPYSEIFRAVSIASDDWALAAIAHAFCQARAQLHQAGAQQLCRAAGAVGLSANSGRTRRAV